MYVLFTAMEEYVSNALLETLLSSSSTTEMLSNLVLKMQDDTQEEWYIEGFEDYDNSFSEAVGAILDSKGMGKLEAGDTLQFVFDRYTQDGELISSTTEGRPVVVPASGSTKVELKAIKDGEYIIGGVLTDVYQRKMTSKIVNVQ